MRIWGVFLSALNLLDLCRSQVITSHFKGESLDSESLQEVETLSAHSALHCSAACGSKLGGLNSCSATRFDKLSNSCVCGRKRRLHWSELGSGSQPGKTYMVSANCNQGQNNNYCSSPPPTCPLSWPKIDFSRGLSEIFKKRLHWIPHVPHLKKTKTF